MTKPIRALVDPHILRVPDPCEESLVLEDYIDSLLDWSDLAKREDVRILVSSSATAALYIDQEYPDRTKLSSLCARVRNAVADANTLSRHIEGLLMNSEELDNHLILDVVLFEESSSRIQPSYLLDRLKPNSRSEFLDALVKLSVDKRLRAPQHAPVTFLVSAPHVAPETEPRMSVCVNALVDTISLTSGLPEPQYRSAFDIEIETSIAFSSADLFARLDLCEVWQKNLTTELASIVIELRVNRFQSSEYPDAVPTPFKIGECFMASAEKWDAIHRRDYAGLLIDSCARIVVGDPKNPVNIFRVGKNSGSPQRIREDGARAYRTHLTSKGIALRLMFGKLQDGSIEFANLGAKSELEIL